MNARTHYAEVCMRGSSRLSSTATPIFRFVWPVLWLGLIGYFLVASLLGWQSVRWRGGGPAPLWGKLLLLLLFILGIVCAHAYRRLKHVELAGGSLHVADLVAREVVPLAAISAVTVRGDFSHHGIPIVRLHFRNKTHFGSSVDFMAASQQKLDELLGALGKDIAVRWR